MTLLLLVLSNDPESRSGKVVELVALTAFGLSGLLMLSLRRGSAGDVEDMFSPQPRPGGGGCCHRFDPGVSVLASDRRKSGGNLLSLP